MSAPVHSQDALDRLLQRAHEQLDLDAETERELLDELRAHFEEAFIAARARGLDEDEALTEVARRFGIEETARELQAVHLGWGAADGVVAAALPVICTLLLRWSLFPHGVTLRHMQHLLMRPEFWGIALAALLLPVIQLRRWRYALASWAFFWTLSVLLWVAQSTV